MDLRSTAGETRDPAVEADRARLAAAMERDPRLRVCLARACDLFDRQGNPPKRLSLGDGFSDSRALGAWREVFCRFVTVSGATGRAFLDLAGFLADLGPDRAAAWTQALFAALGRTPRNRSAEAAQRTTAVTGLLTRWRSAFPQLPAVADLLDAQAGRWQREVEADGVDALESRWVALGQALSFLAVTREPAGLAELGSRFFGGSKVLRAGPARRLLLDALAALDGGGAGQVEPEELLRRFGICDNPTALKASLFGSFRYRKAGRWYDWIAALHAAGEAATLTLQNLDGIDALELGGDAPPSHLCTCENETPFCRLVQARHAAPVLYTEGYPNAAVRRVVQLLPPPVRLLHWGDTDLDGLRIAAILRSWRPLALWRCGVDDSRRCAERLLPFTPDQKRRAEVWLAAHPDFPFVDELAFALAHGWLEQEAWLPAQ